MPRVNRAEICAADEVQVFHLVNRCVRRTHLCGADRRSRKDYSHRKQWIRNRLEGDSNGAIHEWHSHWS